MEAVGSDSRDIPLSTMDSMYEEVEGSSVSLGDILVIAGEDVDSEEFVRLVMDAAVALDEGINAELIKAGSSGSYFIRDRQKVITVAWSHPI